MHDILRETPIYQKILNEGRQEGQQEGALYALRETIVDIVQAHFPTLTHFAEQQLTSIEQPAALRQFVVKISSAQTADEARRYLQELDKV